MAVGPLNLWKWFLARERKLSKYRLTNSRIWEFCGFIGTTFPPATTDFIVTGSGTGITSTFDADVSADPGGSVADMFELQMLMNHFSQLDTQPDDDLPEAEGE